MRRSWLLILPALVLILAVRTYRNASDQEFSSEVTLARVEKDSPLFGLMALTGHSAEEEEIERLALLAAATDAERLLILRDQEARRQRDSEKLLEFAEQVSPDPVAIDALVRAIEYSPAADVRADAAGRLIRDYLTHGRMAGAPQRLLECGEDEAVEVLEALSREHPDREVRGVATYAVAAVMKGRAERTWGDPAAARDLAERSEDLLGEVLKDYGEVRSGRDMLAELARADLDELTRLRPGRLAPEIDGTDLEGRPMQLSDFRGRVVVLSFWGFW